MQIKNIPAVFRNRITEKGMTVKAVAERANITPSSLSAMLNGRQTITATTFVNLCRVLDLTPSRQITLSSVNKKGV